MQEIVDECAERSMHVRGLPAIVAMAAHQRRAAIQAGTFVGVTLIARASIRFNGSCRQARTYGVAQNL